MIAARSTQQQWTLAAIGLLLMGVPTAKAQDASAWQGELHAAARLIGGATQNASEAKWLRAGIEIRLDRGWKTYWRYPGDSGTPPSLDFSGSENVSAVTALWPAPERFSDGAGGYSIGYLHNVVLPLRVVPKNAAKPSSLHAKLGYAVCGSLCIPAEADLNLKLSGKAGTEEPELIAAEARVPRRVRVGADPGSREGLAIRSVHRQTESAHERVVVEVAVPEGAPVDLFAEGPTSDWALPLPEPDKSAPNNVPGLRRFSFVLDGLPPGVRAQGAKLTLTAVSPTDAIEVEVHLD